MTSFLLGLIDRNQAHSEFVLPNTGSVCCAFAFVIPCATASISESLIGLLPVISHKEGQHEKNVNQRNSTRRDACRPS